MTRRKFRIGDLVEWEENGITQYGEIISYNCFYRPWYNFDYMSPYRYFELLEYRYNTHYYLVRVLLTKKERVVFEDRLRKTKVRVVFTRSATFI